MAEPFIGQIIMCGFDFEPDGYAFCDGRLLSIAEYDALFALIGTTFGGDGQSTFALPDLRGRAGIHMGTGPGLSNASIGGSGGQETVVLTGNQMPAHNHFVMAHGAPATSDFPGAGTVLAGHAGFGAEGADGTLAPSALGPVGAGQPHDNMQPYLVVNYVIALVGIFPSRN